MDEARRSVIAAVEKAMDASLYPEFQWWESSEERIAFILDVAEPLIRAEERADADRRADRIILRGAQMMADLRAQIAADIEARTHVHAGLDIKCDFCVAFRSAARIARGES